MLIPTISFEIHDFAAHTTEEFLIHDTIENQEKVFTTMFPGEKRSIRNIKFNSMFSFQLAREMAMPVEFIDPLILMSVLCSVADKEMVS